MSGEKKKEASCDRPEETKLPKRGEKKKGEGRENVKERILI